MGKKNLRLISGGQLRNLIAISSTSAIFLNVPSLLAETAEFDGLPSFIIGYFVVFGIALVIAKSFSNSEKSWFEMMSENKFGRVINFFLFLIYLYLGALSVRFIGDVFNSAFLVNTPIIVLIIMSAILAVFILKDGIELLARISGIVYVPIITAIAAVFLGVVSKIEFKNYFPLFGFGPLPVIKGTYYVAGTYLEHIFFFLAIIPFVQEKKQVVKQGLLGFSVGYIAGLLMVIGCFGVFNPMETKRFYVAPLQLAKVVEIGTFINGIEIVLVAVWSIASVTELTIFLYTSLIALKNSFQVKIDNLILPSAALLIALSTLPHDSIHTIREFQFIDNYIMIPLVAIIYVTIFIKKKERSI